jgi:hypothetical protein
MAGEYNSSKDLTITKNLVENEGMNPQLLTSEE